MRIFRGEIRRLYATHGVFCGEKYKVHTKSMVVKHDSPFYYNFLGMPVSLEYGTFLPTKDEAEVYVSERVKANPSNVTTTACLYVDYGKLHSEEISKKEFKQLKKSFKQSNR